VNGCFDVDCKVLPAVLETVPARCLDGLRGLITDLVRFEIDSFVRIFKSYTTHLRAEPSTLDAFVNVCVNQVLDVLDRNKFGTLLKFKVVHPSAIRTRDVLGYKCVFELRKLVKARERKLHEFQERATNISACIADAGIVAFPRQTVSLRQAAMNIETSMTDCIRYQCVLGVNRTDFPGFRALHHVLKQWWHMSLFKTSERMLRHSRRHLLTCESHMCNCSMP
jgi:hypothetical protein